MIIANNGIDEKKFNTFKECADHFGVSVGTMREICVFNNTREIRGWKFKFIAGEEITRQIEDDGIINNLSKNFSYLMHNTGMSYKTISEKTGIPVSSLKEILISPNIKVSRLLVLCKFFDKEPSWFFNPIEENWSKENDKLRNVQHD